MKITIVGGTGWLGSEIALEAVHRGHSVTVISRNPEDIRYTMMPDLPSLKADAASLGELMQTVPDDTDVLVNALIPDPFVHDTFTAWCRNVLECCRAKRIGRLIAVADACVFEVRPGLRLNETTFLTPFYRDWFGEHLHTHEMYLQEKEVDWLEIAPAAKCLPDKQLREYDIAVDRLCTLDERVAALNTPDPDHYPFADTSFISTQDFGFAVVDEIEHRRFSRTRICVAWKTPHQMYQTKEAAE